MLGVPYVGAGVLGSALCMDKVVFKELMAQAGLPQVGYALVEAGRARPSLEHLGFPLWVKPARLGSSVGISKVSGAEELDGALETAFQHDGLAIVEAFSPGIEVECSVIGNGEPEASVPGEIVLQGADWYDYAAKYQPGGMELLVPARLPEHVREEVRRLACDTFERVGCTGLARVDFFVEGDRVLVNELNTMPGFTATSVYASLFAASGIPYDRLLDRLVTLALEWHAAESGVRH